jgi:hypothetical protein
MADRFDAVMTTRRGVGGPQRPTESWLLEHADALEHRGDIGGDAHELCLPLAWTAQLPPVAFSELPARYCVMLHRNRPGEWAFAAAGVTWPRGRAHIFERMRCKDLRHAADTVAWMMQRRGGEPVPETGPARLAPATVLDDLRGTPYSPPAT